MSLEFEAVLKRLDAGAAGSAGPYTSFCANAARDLRMLLLVRTNEIIADLGALLSPLLIIAQAYDDNALDDEARKRWSYGENTTPPEQIILYTGRGGKTLLTLADAFRARDFMKNLPAVIPPSASEVEAVLASVYGSTLLNTDACTVKAATSVPDDE